jgi:hypothetical protein
MCAPIAPALVLGVASAVTTAVGTIGSYSNQQAQVNAQYEAQQAAYTQQQQAFNRQQELNQVAAQRAYMSEQVKLRAKYQQAAIEADKLKLEAQRAAGSIQASGKTGRSIGLISMDPNREYGRDLAVLGLNLGFAQDDYFQAIESTYNQTRSATNTAFSAIGPAPVRQPGPSPLGLISGLGGAALGGYGLYNDLQPPVKPTV